jgi:hypothetical protein
VHALQVESESRRGQIDAEALQQPVVATATAEHVPERRVVDLEDGAAVVAEVAQQPEVDLDPLGDATCLQRFEGLADAGGGALDRGAPLRARLVEHLFPATQLRERHAGGGLLVADSLQLG